jgi:hypothetical protein
MWTSFVAGIAHHSPLTRAQRMTGSYQIKIKSRGLVASDKNKVVQVQSFTGPRDKFLVTQSTQHFPLSDIQMTLLTVLFKQMFYEEFVNY